jgi:hypothetical protein
LQGWFAVPEALDRGGPASCRRIPVAPGVEVLIDEEHPLLRTGIEPAAIADALRDRLARLLPGVETE